MQERQLTNWQEIMARARRENWSCLPSPPDPRDYPLSRIAEPVELPPAVRLDHLLPRVPDQGRCGSCVGKASANILNSYYNHKDKLPDGGLSALYIYSRCKQEDGIPGTEGTYLRVALKVMLDEGSCPEVDLPYSQLLTNCLKFPAITQAHRQAAAPYRIKAYARLWNLDEVKQALANGKLVLAGVWVTSSFMHWNGADTIGLPDGSIYGLHAVKLCGYDDRIKAVRGANSWGPQWGDKGFFWLSYDFCKWTNPDLGGMPALTEVWAVEVDNLPVPAEPAERLIELWIDKPVARVDGVGVGLDVPPQVINGRTVLPLRFVSEQLGAKVDYIKVERKVEIRTQNNKGDDA